MILGLFMGTRCRNLFQLNVARYFEVAIDTRTQELLHVVCHSGDLMAVAENHSTFGLIASQILIQAGFRLSDQLLAKQLSTLFEVVLLTSHLKVVHIDHKN